MSMLYGPISKNVDLRHATGLVLESHNSVYNEIHLLYYLLYTANIFDYVMVFDSIYLSQWEGNDLKGENVTMTASIFNEIIKGVKC